MCMHTHKSLLSLEYVNTNPQKMNYFTKSSAVFPPSQKERGRGGGERYNFSIRSKQIKHSNDHIKGNQVRKGGGHPFGGNTASVLIHSTSDC